MRFMEENDLYYHIEEENKRKEALVTKRAYEKLKILKECDYIMDNIALFSINLNNEEEKLIFAMIINDMIKYLQHTHLDDEIVDRESIILVLIITRLYVDNKLSCICGNFNDDYYLLYSRIRIFNKKLRNDFFNVFMKSKGVDEIIYELSLISGNIDSEMELISTYCDSLNVELIQNLDNYL